MIQTDTETLPGRATMGADDPCAEYFQALVESEAAFKAISADSGISICQIQCCMQ